MSFVAEGKKIKKSQEPSPTKEKNYLQNMCIRSLKCQIKKKIIISKEFTLQDWTHELRG